MSLFWRSRVCKPVSSARCSIESTESSLLFVQISVRRFGQQDRLLSLLIRLLLMLRVSKLVISSRWETSLRSLFWTNLHQWRR